MGDSTQPMDAPWVSRSWPLLVLVEENGSGRCFRVDEIGKVCGRRLVDGANKEMCIHCPINVQSVLRVNCRSPDGGITLMCTGKRTVLRDKILREFSQIARVRQTIPTIHLTTKYDM